MNKMPKYRFVSNAAFGEVQVKNIRKNKYKYTYRQLASYYHVSLITIKRILAGKTYRWVK